MTEKSAATNKYTTLDAEALAASMRKVEGVSVVATVNEDGTPNAGVFVPMIVDSSHVVMTLAPNRTKENIERTGACAVVYDVADAAAAEKADRHKGARLTLELVRPEDPDHASVAAAWPHMTPYTLIFRIKCIRPIG